MLSHAVVWSEAITNPAFAILQKTQITLPRAIRPKPPPLAPRIQLSDGTILPSIQPKEVPVITQEELLRRVFSLVPSQPPDPDEFRPPKRKRSKRGTSRSGVDKAMLPEVGSHKRRTGRPSRLRKPTGALFLLGMCHASVNVQVNFQ